MGTIINFPEARRVERDALDGLRGTATRGPQVRASGGVARADRSCFVRRVAPEVQRMISKTIVR
jgi:hypothetical protein